MPSLNELRGALQRDCDAFPKQMLQYLGKLGKELSGHCAAGKNLEDLLPLALERVRGLIHGHRHAIKTTLAAIPEAVRRGSLSSYEATAAERAGSVDDFVPEYLEAFTTELIVGDQQAAVAQIARACAKHAHELQKFHTLTVVGHLWREENPPRAEALRDEQAPDADQEPPANEPSSVGRAGDSGILRPAHAQSTPPPAEDGSVSEEDGGPVFEEVDDEPES